ncbi:hypothetical protein GE061_013128 [Apolygus lucorum]|uniref:Reverse transcriptase domain-containing protein n=1 Tax=Apolygus lucorum TaxID=248454 RepID=A0A6A4JUM9_APOLU|nr:hypothetical protein GE061_013128 [Apolygus lucorum]
MTGMLRKTNKVKLLNSSEEPVLLLADIHDEWLQYTSRFFSDTRPPESEWDGDLAGPSILESEVVHAIRCSKNNKAPGPDDIHSESLKCLGDAGNFKYLGVIVNERWDPEVEIRARIEQARAAFVRMKSFFCDKHLSFGIRYRTLRCYIWSVLLYGVERWTIKIASVNRLEAFEMWCLRRMFRISWVQRVRNTEVLRRAGLEDRQLFKDVKRRKIGYLGHVFRGDRYAFQRLVLEGKIEGRRGIGRKQLSWLRDIRRWTGIHDFATLKAGAIERTLHAV